LLKSKNTKTYKKAPLIRGLAHEVRLGVLLEYLRTLRQPSAATSLVKGGFSKFFEA